MNPRRKVERALLHGVKQDSFGRLLVREAGGGKTKWPQVSPQSRVVQRLIRNIQRFGCVLFEAFEERTLDGTVSSGSPFTLQQRRTAQFAPVRLRRRRINQHRGRSLRQESAQETNIEDYVALNQEQARRGLRPKIDNLLHCCRTGGAFVNSEF